MIATKSNKSDKPTSDTPVTLAEPCQVSDNSDGSLSVSFRVDEFAAKRLKLRANGMPLSRYMWENILKGVVDGHVF